MSSSSSAASSPIASKGPGTSGASGRPGSRMNIAASSFDAASTSQVRLKDAYLGGSKEKQQGDLPQGREENSIETDNSGSEPWYYFKKNEACGKPLAGGLAEVVSSEFQISHKTVKERLWNTSLPYRHITSLTRMTSTTWSEKSTQRPAGDPMKYLDVVNISECHSQSSSSSRK